MEFPGIPSLFLPIDGVQKQNKTLNNENPATQNTPKDVNEQNTILCRNATDYVSAHSLPKETSDLIISLIEALKQTIPQTENHDIEPVPDVNSSKQNIPFNNDLIDLSKEQSKKEKHIKENVEVDFLPQFKTEIPSLLAQIVQKNSFKELYYSTSFLSQNVVHDAIRGQNNVCVIMKTIEKNIFALYFSQIPFKEQDDFVNDRSFHMFQFYSNGIHVLRGWKRVGDNSQAGCDFSKDMMSLGEILRVFCGITLYKNKKIELDEEFKQYYTPEIGFENTMETDMDKNGNTISDLLIVQLC
ncbi:hypothetical protein EIN_184950 [Entamoeba invadens IP1]|uniref:hypothetical protein n=1 Tax=Entamoeba invadens IP1 TaxID=370355 RepID=UPI0002C3DDF5|nr:hypothetical protein EIN_184950 [Entamoeba invadens IP1]ELP94118.1 hypothetical protein EIN_184950 [Entamoeba invadens IP1]|eukprot:XP_004260889.1 hypothetical protein EIN_184950 [Entamoeba invadens IP1]